MAGILRTDTIQNSNTSTIITQTNSTTITIGTTGQTVALASGATSSGFGATYNGAVNWDTTPKTTTVTAVSGYGYFINTTAGAITVNLPAAIAGSTVALADYANTWNTNNVTVAPNGTDKIGGANANAILSVQGQSVTFTYVDSTQGWKNVLDSTSNVVGNSYIIATGGTITTSGNYKIHTFTGPGTFTVSAAASSPTNNNVDYLVVAGGGGGQGGRGGGGGAGGYRESKSPTAPWTASPLASSTSLPVSATGYPITVGGGGVAGTVANPAPVAAGTGNNSIFSTITSAGGAAPSGVAGGSGSGGVCVAGGSGNTPPVSPPQGNPGGTGNSSGYAAGGGGGAGGAGGNGSGTAGTGGVGVTTSITGSSLAYAGGGGGGASGSYGGTPGAGSPCGTGGAAGNGVSGTAGTTNRGGGGGSASSQPCQNGGAGGSGVVVIRYKFQ